MMMTMVMFDDGCEYEDDNEDDLHPGGKTTLNNGCLDSMALDPMDLDPMDLDAMDL